MNWYLYMKNHIYLAWINLYDILKHIIVKRHSAHILHKKLASYTNNPSLHHRCVACSPPSPICKHKKYFHGTHALKPWNSKQREQAGTSCRAHVKYLELYDPGGLKLEHMSHNLSLISTEAMKTN